ncbi:MAG: hypothetical protein WHU94_06360 [Thermogemmata sp.]
MAEDRRGGGRWVLLSLALLGWLSGGAGTGLTAAAQDWPIRITAARLGFPTEDETPLARFGQWTPLDVTFQLQTAVPETAELVLSAPDTDGITTIQRVPLPLEKAEAGRSHSTLALGAWTYVRPIGGTDILIEVRGAASGQLLSEPFRLRLGRLRDTLAYSVLFLGLKPPHFELPKPVGGDAANAGGLRGGRVLTATLTAVEQLPGHWFGYDTVDLAVLFLGEETREFVEQLWSAGAAPLVRQRREALLEWVRRGGRLVVAGGSLADSVARLPDLQEVLPVAIRGQRQADVLLLHWNAPLSSQFGVFHGALGSKQGRFPVADCVRKPHPAVRVLIPPPERQHDPSLMLAAAQWPFGLGRLTCIAFDLHGPPFTEFPLRSEFWDWVLREGGAARASVGSEGKPKPLDADVSEEEDELAAALRAHADTFEGIPVISFGWVAVLLVLYLLVIGPLEYLLLKRLIGRQEWTWVTFPIIVLTVTVLAFLSASRWKGQELRVNKLDVVDVDVAAGRVYGTTWLGLFSPRIEHYTLSVTAQPEWAGTTSDTVIGWWGAPRGPRAGLLRRQYQWSPWRDQPLGVLQEVPIQVWSTKAFVASWSGRWPAQEPRVRCSLEHPPADGRAVIGSFTLDLPVPVLADCVLFYAGQAYPVPGGVVLRGQKVQVVLDGGTRADQWLQRESRLEELLWRAPVYRERLGPVRGTAGGAAPPPVSASARPEERPASTAVPLLGLLFHEGSLSFAEGVFPRNASLRRLDQSWRLHPEHTSEIILVGRAVLPVGDAESQVCGPFSPSLLWWRQPPDGMATRTPLTGRGRQETWVRLYLPIASSSTVAGQPQP